MRCPSSSLHTLQGRHLGVGTFGEEAEHGRPGVVVQVHAPRRRSIRDNDEHFAALLAVPQRMHVLSWYEVEQPTLQRRVSPVSAWLLYTSQIKLNGVTLCWCVPKAKVQRWCRRQGSHSHGARSRDIGASMAITWKYL